MIPRDRVRALLADFAEVPSTDDVPLVIDSLALVQLVEALEDEGSLRIAAREVTRENFGTIDAIVAFLEAKR
jgi:acyl carrier protein